MTHDHRRKTGTVIGLLGGSFNPPHTGHEHMAEYARTALALDEVWLLVSPQNPLKSTQDMAPFDHRLALCTHLCAPHAAWLKASDAEQRFGTTRTFDTLQALRQSMPETHFIFLMGADNFETLHHWHRWKDLMATLPMAIFQRAGTKTALLSCPAATHDASLRVDAPHDLRDRLGGWCLLDHPHAEVSATHLRAQLREPSTRGSSIKGLPERVHRYIVAHTLYTA